MIKISNLLKSYNRKVALDIDSLFIKEKEIVGILGDNGAGKTTLFSCILNFIKPVKGEIHFKGLDISKTENWKSYTSAFLNEGFLIGFLTPEEYFVFLGKSFGISKGEVMQYINQFEDIFNGEILNKKKYIRNFSKGNQKKIGLIGSMIGNPKLVIWDEPFSNLDPSTQLKVRKFINLQKDERTFLISSHDLNHIAETCSRIIILKKGKIVEDLQKGEFSLEELHNFFYS